jgi:hypothetical protein
MKVITIAILASVNLLFAQNINQQNTVDYSLDLNTTGINKLLIQNLRMNLQSQILDLQKHASTKMYGECHIGIGYQQKKTPAFLNIKFNPINQKLPGTHILKAKLFAAKQTAKLLGDSVSSENIAALENIQSQLNIYDKKKWIRPSIGIIIPFYILYTDTTWGRYSPIDTAITMHTETRHGLIFLNSYGIVLGYDLGDIATISVGCTDIFHKRNLFVGASLDLSTPVYSLSYGFISFIQNFSNQRLGNTQMLY